MKTKMKRNIEDASLDYWPCLSAKTQRVLKVEGRHQRGIRIWGGEEDG